MTKSNLTKLFQAIALVGFAIALNALLIGQGGKALLSQPILGEDRITQAFFAIYVVSALLILMSIVGIWHSLRFGRRWHERMPVVWLEGVDTSRFDARIYQAVIIVLLVVAPAVGLLKFEDTLQDGKLCVTDTGKVQLVKDMWQLPNAAGPGQQVRLLADRPKIDGKEVCAGGAQVWPVEQFTWLLRLQKLAIGLVILFLASLLRGPFLTGPQEDVSGPAPVNT